MSFKNQLITNLTEQLHALTGADAHGSFSVDAVTVVNLIDEIADLNSTTPSFTHLMIQVDGGEVRHTVNESDPTITAGFQVEDKQGWVRSRRYAAQARFIAETGTVTIFWQKLSTGG